MDYDRADGKLTGHPRLVLNKGRVGFAARDRARYAPESGATFPLHWIAVHADLAPIPLRCRADRGNAAGRGTGRGQARRVHAGSAEHGDPADYVWLPVHPWQARRNPRHALRGRVRHRPGCRSRHIERSLRAAPDRPNARQPLARRPPRRQDRALRAQHAGLPRPELRRDPGRTVGHPLAAGSARPIRCCPSNTASACSARSPSVSVRHPLFGALEELPYRFHETLGVLWREPLAPGSARRSARSPSPPCRTATRRASR